MISVSFYLCNLCLCEFLYRICWMKIIQTLEIIETQHFDTSNYITNRRSPSSKSNKWTITISVYFFHISHRYSRAKNKNCVAKTLFTSFTRRNFFHQVWKNFFIILNIRSHAKYLHFCELNIKTRTFLRVVSLSASSLVVLCLYCNLNVLYLHNSTQC